jgi:hypothetical protein
MGRPVAMFVDLQDGLALGRQTADVTGDELLQLTFAHEEKGAAKSRAFFSCIIGAGAKQTILRRHLKRHRPHKTSSQQRSARRFDWPAFLVPQKPARQIASSHT